MHKYLSAIGFKHIKDSQELHELLITSINTAEKCDYYSIDRNSDWMFAEFDKRYAEDIGLVIRGDYDEANKYIMSYYLPYYRSRRISTTEEITVERLAEKEAYEGVCEDLRVGVSLIFYLQNMLEYKRLEDRKLLPILGTTLSLSGLSISGTILMPVEKSSAQRDQEKEMSVKRCSLLQAAKRGDEEAIEHLTLGDMETYNVISKKIHTTDVYTLVDNYLMPYGVECDHYSILGEITELEEAENELTGEKLYKLKLNCNDMFFDICINAEDLVGEPLAGRRFRGVIWLQGFINFPQPV